MSLEPLSVVDGVQRAQDVEGAWQGFRRLLAQDGFERIMCVFGVPFSEPFPDARQPYVPFYRDSLMPADVVGFFARHPEYKRHNPVLRHVRSSPLPLLRIGDNPAASFGPAHQRMLAELRELFGDVDINAFPLSNAAARQYGQLGVQNPRSREARYHLQRHSNALHLAAHYFYGAMQSRFPRPPVFSSKPLSPRQQQCLTWVAAGLTSDQIADRLNLSRKTVDLHLAAAIRKMEAGSRSQAVARAVALGLVSP
ncbi:MAG: helix-turn-helix transcriptional regulator [Gammaproteobacteria bacterium]